MATVNGQVLVSSDSHVVEDAHMWEEGLPDKLKDAAPKSTQPRPGEPDSRFLDHPGGWDPVAHVEEMKIDGVSAEILYPSFAMNLFSLEDPEVQDACFQLYNDYLAQFCSTARDRLLSVAMISTWEIERAVKELERCKGNGHSGAMVWLVPPEELSFATDHYDPLWEACAGLDMPVSLHAVTGTPYKWNRLPVVGGQNATVAALARFGNTGTLYAANALSDIILGGALERFASLKFVLVEVNASWIPFFLSRFDANMNKGKLYRPPMSLTPHEYFERQCFVTFIDDEPLAKMLGYWGAKNCMWSNDFPHAAATGWPHSREIIERDLGHLPQETLKDVLGGNAMRIYPSLSTLTALV